VVIADIQSTLSSGAEAFSILSTERHAVMKKTLSTGCILFVLAMAGSALAENTVKATLETPVSGHIKLIAAHALFDCEGTTCIAPAAPEEAFDAYACKDLASHVGRVASYQEFKPLDQEALAKCNTAAVAPHRR
jgi:hypothetical protein